MLFVNHTLDAIILTWLSPCLGSIRRIGQVSAAPSRRIFCEGRPRSLGDLCAVGLRKRPSCCKQTRRAAAYEVLVLRLPGSSMAEDGCRCQRIPSGGTTSTGPLRTSSSHDEAHSRTMKHSSRLFLLAAADSPCGAQGPARMASVAVLMTALMCIYSYYYGILPCVVLLITTHKARPGHAYKSKMLH